MQLPPLTRKILNTLENFHEYGKVIEIDAHPMPGKQVSTYYQQAIEIMQERKKNAYWAWVFNEVKFIVNRV